MFYKIALNFLFKKSIREGISAESKLLHAVGLITKENIVADYLMKKINFPVSKGEEKLDFIQIGDCLAEGLAEVINKNNETEQPSRYLN